MEKYRGSVKYATLKDVSTQAFSLPVEARVLNRNIDKLNLLVSNM